MIDAIVTGTSGGSCWISESGDEDDGSAAFSTSCIEVQISLQVLEEITNQGWGMIC